VLPPSAALLVRPDRYCCPSRSLSRAASFILAHAQAATDIDIDTQEIHIMTIAHAANGVSPSTYLHLTIARINAIRCEKMAIEHTAIQKFSFVLSFFSKRNTLFLSRLASSALLYAQAAADIDIDTQEIHIKAIEHATNGVSPSTYPHLATARTNAISMDDPAIENPAIQTLSFVLSFCIMIVLCTSKCSAPIS
jgi:hypothetical protein